MEQDKSLHRLDGIELLRGFAAIAVVVVHVLVLGGFVNHTPFTNKIGKLTDGVSLFYAVSAFSLLYGYEKKIFDEQTLKRFYLRRYLRLAPLFYFMFVMHALIFKKVPDIGTTILNLTFTFGLIPTQHESFVWAGWSLGIEWLFYWVFPLFVILVRSPWLLSGAFIISLSLSITYPLLGNDIITISPTLSNMHIIKQFLFFVSGAVAYRLIPVAQYVKNNYPGIKKAELVFLILVASLFMQKLIPLELVESIFFIFLLLWVIVGYSKLFCNKITLMLGKFSYGLYLLNSLTIFYLNRFGVYSYLRDSIGNFHLSFLISCLLSLIIITLLSALSYYLIEQPFQRLGQTSMLKINMFKSQPRLIIKELFK